MSPNLSDVPLSYESNIPIPRQELEAAAPYRTDALLLQACLAGEQAAWNELVERYQPLVYSIARRYGLSPDDAESVLHKVFLSVYHQLSSLCTQKVFLPLLVQLTKDVTLNSLQRAENPSSPSSQTVLPEAAIAADISRWQTQHLLLQAIARLDPQCRRLVEAALAETPPSSEQLAKMLGCSLTDLDATGGRCLEKLHALLIEVGVDLLR